MKAILPSLREKKRYIVFEVISKGQVSFQEASSAIVESLSRFLGGKELAKASPVILPDRWSKSRQRGIIRINHNYMDAAKACFCMIGRVTDEAIVRSVTTSGTLKKASAIMRR